MIRKEILNKSLSRPDWKKQFHRSQDLLWLDKNECINPEMNDLVKKILHDISDDAVYSYPQLDTLYKKIAKLDSINSENLLITSGSDGAIRACFEISIKAGDKILLTKPTFAMYEVYAKIYGADINFIEYEKSLNGPYLDLSKIIDVLNNLKPKLFCLPNPNSPTGTIFSETEIENILITSEKNGTLVLIDEAYYPIYPKTATKFICKFKNLVIVRSFSKAWGAAGLRVGYAISNKMLVEFMHKQKPMYEIGNVSAKTVEKLLDFENEMKLSIKKLEEGKSYFQDRMKFLGFKTYKSYGNFFHINFNDYTSKVHKVLKNRIYYRESFDLDCLKGYSRFTSTTLEKFIPITNLISDLVSDTKKV